MSLAVIALIVGVIALTYVIVQWRREQIERAYERGDTLRKLGTFAFVVIVAWTLIRSGDPVLIGIAVLGFVFATIYVIIEEPHKTAV